MMADTARSERATVDQTPDPEEIDRTPAGERASKMPSMPGTAMDPKKMIGFAAAAGAIMFTVLALGTGLTGNYTLPPAKPKPALEPAQYDPATVIAPTLEGAATDPNAPIPVGEPLVPAIGPQTAPPPAVQPGAPAIAGRSAARSRTALIADRLWRGARRRRPQVSATTTMAARRLLGANPRPLPPISTICAGRRPSGKRKPGHFPTAIS